MKRKNRSILALTRALSRTPAGPLYNAEGGEGGGGGGNEPPRMLTFEEHQAQLNKVVGQRIGEVQKKHQDELTKIQEQLATLQAERDEANEKLSLAGKSAEDQAKILAEKASKQREREIQEYNAKLTTAEQRAEAAEKKYRDTIVSIGLGSGLDQSKVLSSAREAAIRIFRESSEVELDDSGTRIVSVTYEGVAYKSAQEAAAAFLKQHDYFASASTPAGGGSRPPNAGGGRSNGVPLHELSQDELLARAAQTQRR